MLSVHHDKRSIKQQNPSKNNKKKNPTKKTVKVVYISNPMKVKTSASQFSALVQELTGQDADVPNASKLSPEFEEDDVTSGGHPHDSTAPVKVVADHDVTATFDEVPNECPTTYQYQQGSNEIESFHGFDNVEMTQMLGNYFPGFEPSNLWYES